MVDLTDFRDSPPPPKKQKLNAEPDARSARKTRDGQTASSEISPFFRRSDPTSTEDARRRRAEAIAQAVAPAARKALNRYKAPPVDTLAARSTASDVVPDSQSVASQRHEEWERRLNDPRGLIPRRRSFNLDEAAAKSVRAQEDGRGTPDPEADDDDDEIEEVIKVKPKPGKSNAKSKKSKEDVGPSGLTYTPLEKQYTAIKEANPDVLILMEVGYKFRFFAEDAIVASRELGIAAFPNRNFYSASIPTHRLDIHVKKLVEQGHLVGVVRQTETAALKAAGDNRSKPFERKLTNLYTAATYVEGSSTTDFRVDSAGNEQLIQANNGAFVCLSESLRGGMGADDKVRITLVAAFLQTGEVVYDSFDDDFLRNELETRFAHISASEVLIPEGDLSSQTEKLIRNLAASSRWVVAPLQRLFLMLAQNRRTCPRCQTTIRDICPSLQDGRALLCKAWPSRRRRRRTCPLGVSCRPVQAANDRHRCRHESP